MRSVKGDFETLGDFYTHPHNDQSFVDGVEVLIVCSYFFTCPPKTLTVHENLTAIIFQRFDGTIFFFQLYHVLFYW